MPSMDSSRLLRWSRWGIVLASLIVGLVLVLPTWLGYVGALETSRIVARGQGLAIEEGIRGRLHAVKGLPRESDLTDILEALSPSGLRYLQISGRETIAVGAADISSTHSNRSRAPGPSFIFESGRARMETRLPPPPGERGRPGPPRHGHHAPNPARLDAPPPPEVSRGPRLILEYDSAPATGLVSRARTSLLINSSAAVALLIASWFAFFWLRRQEHGELARTRARHLATLGEMSAVLAHEIRNPLASLKGHAQLLAESLQESPEKERKADRVVKEAIRLETLTNDLLDFVRTGETHLQLCDPRDVLRAACADVDSDNIVITVPPDLQECMIDGDRMQQALTNLVRNATQASDKSVDASVGRDEKSLVFEVRDRGPGIPEAELDHIFDAFHTTKVRGTGLGLAVVRRIVELHNGAVGASNHDGGGAVFRIKIPVVSK